jgi:hypothetical protein
LKVAPGWCQKAASRRALIPRMTGDWSLAEALFPIEKSSELAGQALEKLCIRLVGDHLTFTRSLHQPGHGKGLEVGGHRVLRDLQAPRYLSGG